MNLRYLLACRNKIFFLKTTKKGKASAAARSFIQGRDAAPSGSQVSGDAVAVSGCKGGFAAQEGRRRRAIPTMGGRRALPR